MLNTSKVRSVTIIAEVDALGCSDAVGCGCCCWLLAVGCWLLGWRLLSVSCFMFHVSLLLSIHWHVTCATLLTRFSFVSRIDHNLFIWLMRFRCISTASSTNIPLYLVAFYPIVVGVLYELYETSRPTTSETTDIFCEYVRHLGFMQNHFDWRRYHYKS